MTDRAAAAPPPPPRVIASFDVGIKNLAYCIAEVTPAPATEITRILRWGIINMMPPAAASEPAPVCSAHTATGAACTCRASFFRAGVGAFFCKKHTDKTKIIGAKELASIKKKKVEELREYLQTKLGATLPPPPARRDDLLAAIQTTINTHFFIPPPRAAAAAAAPNASEIDLITSAREMTRQLDLLLDAPDAPILTHIYIENQISTIAARMKTIQGMLTQYFVGRERGAPRPLVIKYISSANKLRGRVKKNSTYAERKRIGIEYCGELLAASPHTPVREWAAFFAGYGAKRDDLADCFLQIIGGAEPKVSSL